jgi:hypothetical protein
MILASLVISCSPLRLYRSTSAVATPISQPNNEIIDEFVFDAVLYLALRETEKQAAMELGQWIEMRQEVTPPPPPMVVALAELLSTEQLQELRKKLIAKANEQ